MAIAAKLRPRLRRVRLLALDLDGVLTDGGLYYADSGEELRKFNVKDGLGLKSAMAGGVAVAIVTSSTAPAIGHRVARLGIQHVRLGVGDKLAALLALCAQLGIEPADTAYMSDDVNDLPVLAAVGLPIAVADAMTEVRRAARLVTKAAGGKGAVREVCDLLLAVRHRAGGTGVNKS
jgi:3-deoxy-D-manno-octulosonate 8-phosphate phosphatase (KDO 8-P phosphatase)